MAGLLDQLFATPSDQALFALGSGLFGVRRGQEGQAFQGAMKAYNQAKEQEEVRKQREMQQRLLQMQMEQMSLKQRKEDEIEGFWRNQTNFMGQSPALPPSEMDPEGAPASKYVLPPQMVAQNMLRSGNPALAQQGFGALQKEVRPPVVVGEGGALVDPSTGRPLYERPKPQSSPTSIQEYLFAKEQGYKGTFEEWDTNRKKAGATNVTVGPQGKLTPMQGKFDEAVAKDLAEWATGGFADTRKNLATLQNVVRQLADPKKELTGTKVGTTLATLGRTALSMSNREAMQALEQVEEVVQRNLRLILGAQFTEKEGERLISRAYNPMLRPDQNAARLNALIKQIGAASQAKQEAYEYYQQHGTMQGWNGKMPSVEDFYRALESAAPEPQQGGGWKIERAN